MPDGGDVSVTLLGTGTSTGVPVIGCDCPVCISEDPRNKRLRTSCWIRVGGLSILIDAGPDLRRQALRAGIRSVDAVLYTHHHYDHIAGVDDLRPFCFYSPSPIPCYGPQETVAAMTSMFTYIFSDSRYPSAPRLSLHAADGPFVVSARDTAPEGDAHVGVRVTPLPVYHGGMEVYGYRIGDFAYITDVSRIPKATFSLLAAIDTLVLDGLRHEPHPTHFTIRQAIEAARAIGARRTYFTHLTHTMDHGAEDAKLPEGFSLAFDGLAFTVPACHG